MIEKHLIFFDQFRTRATKASTTIFIWIISLSIIWLLILVPKNYEIQEQLIPKKNLYAKLNDSQLKSPEVKSESQRDYEVIKKSSDIVTFKLPGWDIQVKTIYSFPLWSLIMFFFLLFLFESRRILLNYFSKGLRYYFINNEDKIELNDISGVNPFWIYPLPINQGHKISNQNLKSGLGIGKNQWTQLFLVYSLHLVIILSQIHVFYMSVVANYYLNDKNLIWVFFNILSLLLSGQVLSRWYNLKFISDQIPTEENLNKISRRRIISELLLLGGTLIFFPVNMLMERSRKIAAKTNPRFVFKTKLPCFQTSLESGFYLNKKSKIIHYVGEDKRVRGVVYIDKLDNIEREEAILTPPNEKPIINPNIVEFILENKSLQSISRNRIDLACDILFNSIKYDVVYELSHIEKPNIRVYDLLAGVSIRYNKIEYLNKLKILVNKSNNETLLSRMSVWSNPNSNWYKKWNSSKELKWTGVLM